MDPIETERRSVEINPFVVDEDTVDVLKQLIVEQVDGIECDDIQTIETLVLDAQPNEGLTSHANILLTTDDTETTSTNE